MNILGKLFGIKSKDASKIRGVGMHDNYVKVLFRFYSNVLDAWTVETMWAKIVNADKGLYQLDSIPFYASAIASDDIIFAEFDETEQMFTYRRTIEYSGNSTIHVVVMDKTIEINTIREIFMNLGCVSERLNDGYFAMEVLAKAKYKPIKDKLAELESTEVISYAESCLSSQHQY